MEKVVTGILSLIIAIPLVLMTVWLVGDVLDQVTNAVGLNLPGYIDFILLFGLLVFGRRASKIIRSYLQQGRQ